MSPLYNYRATVKKVVDGDTIDLIVDLGFHIKLELRVRFMGINAPELSTNEGQIAKAFLTVYLPVNTEVILASFIDSRDKYGRWLGVITKNGETVSANSIMLTNNHAIAYGSNQGRI